jgi:tRNA-dihydrouridine synthase B
MYIGSIKLDNNLVLAPMAGVTDKPFRQLCRQLGAGLTVSEMITSNVNLWNSRKSRFRLDHSGESSPRAIQIAGTDPQLMATAARFSVDNGTEIIDINMGCPARKVCNVMAGSALLRDEILVARILESVVRAVEVPVTLKMRTGWDRNHRNGVKIAMIAEQSGIQMLAVHGRTRACGYTGAVEYETVTAIKSTVKIPVVANGDISGPKQAKQILRQTGVDGLMLGRAAQGNPWLFREINYYLDTGKLLPAPTNLEVSIILENHLNNLFAFYGEFMGVRIARKHIGWYCKHKHGANLFRARVNKAETAGQQLEIVRDYFNNQLQQELAA